MLADAVVKGLKILSIWLLMPVVIEGCGQEEAADPHDILAEEYERADPSATEESGAEPGAAGAKGEDPGLAPATRAECEAAIAHLHALAGAAKTASKDTQAVDECLARGTSQREARCIASIRSEEEIERCSSY